MWPELKTALSWFTAAPKRWIDSAEQDLSAAAEWLLTVIEGDFAEEQSTAQVITGTVISMIPFVDQLCDVRDLVANCRKIKQDSSNRWAWVALVLTLLGLFPTLGSLAKGCFKILFTYGRKGVLKIGAKALETGLWKETSPWLELGIKKLNEFLARPAVRKTLAALKIDNIYKYLADLARKLAGEANTGALLKAMDGVIDALQNLVNLVQKWGTVAMKTRAGHLLQSVKEVRNAANRKLAEVLKPVQEWLDHLARRLEIEADQNYRAVTNARNVHAFRRPTLEAELAELRAHRPAWVDKGPRERFPKMEDPGSKPEWPDISAKASRPLNDAFETFHNAEAVMFAPGAVLYRVIDPGSFDNSICWMSKAEFDKLKSKDDWRRRFAVWTSWNTNGEFVTYTVPPGKPLHAWQGTTASQDLEKEFILEGGAVQIVLNPKDLEKAFLGKRQPTGWGYSSFGETVDLRGVPVRANNWRE